MSEKVLEELRTQLDIERRTVAARIKAKGELRAAALRLLRQPSIRSKVQAAQKAFENLTVAELGIAAGKTYQQHVQNLWDNAARLLSRQPIPPDLQASIDYCYTMLSANTQKGMDAALKLFAKFHKNLTSSSATRDMAFYLGNLTPSAAETIPVIFAAYKHQGWEPEWITAVFAASPPHRDAWAYAIAVQPTPPQPPSFPPQLTYPPPSSPLQATYPPTSSPLQATYLPPTAQLPVYPSLPSPGQSFVAPALPPRGTQIQYSKPGLFVHVPGDITDLPDYPSIDPTGGYPP
jgi:hypothetical protein